MTKLLIDGDWLCFSTAIAFQTVNPFGGDEVIYDEMAAIMTLNKRIKGWKEKLEADEAELHFSCSRENNWRRGLVPSYKMNRNGKASPVGLEALKQYCREHYDTVEQDTFEADDTISIAATGVDKGNCIICSCDKDFLTIPTKIYNPNKNILKKQDKVAAFQFFIYQVIIGDSSDGYKGIPKCGPVGAKKFLAANSKNLHGIWEPLVALAATKKVDEAYLLTQAQMAHLLTSDDLNEDGEIVPWTPDKISSMLK